MDCFVHGLVKTITFFLKSIFLVSQKIVPIDTNRKVDISFVMWKVSFFEATCNLASQAFQSKVFIKPQVRRLFCPIIFLLPYFFSYIVYIFYIIIRLDGGVLQQIQIVVGMSVHVGYSFYSTMLY